MTERPILMEDWSVQGILAGRKTQTRRPVDERWQRFQYAIPLPESVLVERNGSEMTFPGRVPGDYLFHNGIPVKDGEWQPVGCPFHVGQRLWVKEAWMLEGADVRPAGMEWDRRAIYRATQPEFGRHFKWSPSVSMPQWASRLTLLITGVRAHQVQGIDFDDIRAEGVAKGINDTSFEMRTNFATLWDSIYARPKAIRPHGVIVRYVSYPWQGETGINTYRGKPWYVHGNPWVWAVSFEVVKP